MTKTRQLPEADRQNLAILYNEVQDRTARFNYTLGLVLGRWGLKASDPAINVDLQTGVVTVARTGKKR